MMSAPTTQATGYNSESDSGDELFTGTSPRRHETIATLPVSRNQFKGQESPRSYITQPTQPLITPLYNGFHHRTSASPSVQVARSSPTASPAPRQSTGPVPPSMPKGSLNGGILAHSIAPPGTAFRPPAFQQSQPTQVSTQVNDSQTMDISDNETRQVSDSSEDEADRRANDIQPTNFSKGNRPAGFGIRVEDSPQGNFAKYTSTFAYKSEPNTLKRTSDIAASAYASSHRPQKLPRQNVPAKAAPAEEELALKDVQDWNLRRKIVDIQNVLEGKSVTYCLKALTRHRGNTSDAMEWLVEQEANEVKKKKNKNDSIDLTQSDDEVPDPAPAKKTTKRNFDTGASISQKWSSTQQSQRPSDFINQVQKQMGAPQTGTFQQSTKRQAEVPHRSVEDKYSGTKQTQESPEPAKLRRRLLPAKKREPSPVLRSSSPIQPPVQVQTPQKKAAIQFSDEDSAVSSDKEEYSPEFELKLVTIVNTSSAADLIDISGQSSETVEAVVEKRPFGSIDAIKAVQIQTTSKAGNKIKRLVGEKFADACIETLTGYEAVDQLVARCEELGSTVKNEMNSWGINVFGKSGEIEALTLESSHDSGIGTPSSTSVSADEDVAKVTAKKSKLLQQPSMMSSNLLMKDYQVVGLNWLAMLHSKGLSGALCDEMGLGKTCQVIAFFAHLKEIGVKGTHLVIVPGSTVENWLREFQNFCPLLRVEPYYGSITERPRIQAELEEVMDQVDVIVTTYDLAAKSADAKFLRRKVQPNVCICDEGHKLKNSMSQVYSAVMGIPAKMRVLLTGTPLQNNLLELVSLLAFMMPDLFKGAKENLQAIFKHKAKTRDKEHTALLSAQRITRARSMMTPFVLRRKKRQVLKDLPKKTNLERFCEMTPYQRTIYEEIVPRAQNILLRRSGQAVEESPVRNEDRGNVMTELRKAAIHPLLFRRRFSDDILREIIAKLCKSDPKFSSDRLFEDLDVMTDFELHRFCESPPDEITAKLTKWALEPEAWMDSGKVEALVSILAEHRAGGHRTLVFSQFTMVMDILELVFATKDIPFYRLDGQTKMDTRQELIDAFHDDDTPVFMLSTGAGGAGVNLACADRVIIFDCSFNPQTDAQAEDRAHRVGQTREVEVVRLITRDSVEEQILAVAKSKLMLDEKVAGGEDGQRIEEMGRLQVERMIAESLEQKGKQNKDAEVKDESGSEKDAKKSGAKGKKGKGWKDITHRTKAPGAADISVEFGDGLKALGLDLSAREA